jgi:hypothetical protein
MADLLLCPAACSTLKVSVTAFDRACGLYASDLVDSCEHSSNDEQDADEADHDANWQHDHRDTQAQTEDDQHQSNHDRGGVLDEPADA